MKVIDRYYVDIAKFSSAIDNLDLTYSNDLKKVSNYNEENSLEKLENCGQMYFWLFCKIHFSNCRIYIKK